MVAFKHLTQTADWNVEKHVPVIELKQHYKKGEVIEVMVAVGKELAHPNTTEHHIRWISLYFQPTGEKFPYEIGSVTFNAHGESINGPDSSTVYTHHAVNFFMKTEKGGVLSAYCYCNIHGIWGSSLDLNVSL
ncbi:MAG: class II SORL domain-containing protein [Candidatus Margulisbacteria bacterium]|nr:class II SORL domain-containing protein [Candidatus Margulisiibacteriota bacterium]